MYPIKWTEHVKQLKTCRVPTGDFTGTKCTHAKHTTGRDLALRKIVGGYIKQNIPHITCIEYGIPVVKKKNDPTGTKRSVVAHVIVDLTGELLLASCCNSCNGHKGKGFMTGKNVAYRYRLRGDNRWTITLQIIVELQERNPAYELLKNQTVKKFFIDQHYFF